MLFNSLTYLLMLFTVVSAYWLLPYKSRLFLIFCSSLIFYGFWRIEFIPLMLFSVLLDYFMALKISASSRKSSKKIYLLISIFINLGLLFYFKYLIFFTQNIQSIASFMGFEIDLFVYNIILPLGISFYTFQTISYIVDVYRERIEPERDFILYSCYVTFFPQLVAGPILRANEVISQFKNRRKLTFSDLNIGIRRIIYGLFLKVVLADNIAPIVDEGFLIPTDDLSAIDVWTLAFLFGFQIYFDFAAYSHIAIGCARLFGLYFPENFNFPYLATSPKDFWKRWHISLSSWIRDYLYLPLIGVKPKNSSRGGLSNQVNDSKRNSALIITWILMGLWHGASWTFVLWGGFHAIFIFIYRIISNSIKLTKSKLGSFLGFVFTLPLIMLSWIPFRATSIETSFLMWAKIFDISSYTTLSMRENTYLISATLMIGILLVYFAKKQFLKIKKQYLFYISIETTLLSIMITLIFIYFNPVRNFIYFQF